MGIIYDHRSCLRRDLLFQLFQVRLESLRIRRNLHQVPVIIAHIGSILQKIRRENDHFFSRIQDRLQDHVQPAGSAHRHDQVFCGERGSETTVQRSGDGFPHVLKSGVAHISVENHRVLCIHQIDDRFPHTVRRRNAGIPQAEIIDFVCPVLLSQAVALLEHHTDGGIILYKRFHLF